MTAGAFLRIPIEGLAVVFLALVLPPWGRRIMAAVVGVILGLLMVVKILDMGFIEALDRPFDTAGDLAYLGPAVGLLRDSIGHVAGTIAAVAVAVILLAVLVCMPLAVGRLTKLVARHHRWSVRAATGLVVNWIPCAALGLQLGQGESIASTSAGRLVVGEVRAITTGMADENGVRRGGSGRPLRDSADGEPLAGLRGKDVLIAFVESLRTRRDRRLAVIAADPGPARPGYQSAERVRVPARSAHSPHRRSVASAGLPTPRSSPAFGSTTSDVTTDSTRATG